MWRVVICNKYEDLEATSNQNATNKGVKRFRDKHNITLPIDFIIKAFRDGAYGTPFKIRTFKLPEPPKDAPKIEEFVELLTQEIPTYKHDKMTGKSETRGRKVRVHA